MITPPLSPTSKFLVKEVAPIIRRHSGIMIEELARRMEEVDNRQSTTESQLQTAKEALLNTQKGPFILPHR